MLLKQTKTAAPISDRRYDVNFTKELFDAGVNVVRMNIAHASCEGFETLIANVHTVSNRIAILMDIKGPEIHTTASAESILYRIGEKIKIVGDPERRTTRECTVVSYPSFVHGLNIGGTILTDDGDLELRVTDRTSEYLLYEVQNEVTLGSRRSVSVPGVHISLPSLVERGRNNILYAIEKDIGFIAHSFVCNRRDVPDIREILDAHNNNTHIIAKIENQEGVDNIDEILEVANGAIVTHGDLGTEVPQECIPGIQRTLIRKCILTRKPVIIATQMLHAMMNNSCPTRAGVIDTANAICYRTDALMSSGEAMYGKYPAEAVKTITKITAQAEKDKLEESGIRTFPDENNNDVTALPTKRVVKATTRLKIRAIIVNSYQERTMCNLAAFHGKYPVLTICYKEKTMRHLALFYRVEAIYTPELTNEQKHYFAVLRRLLKEGRLYPVDMVGYLGSGKAGTQTSFLEISVAEGALEHTGDSVLPNSSRHLQDEMKETDLLDKYILKHIDEEGEYLKVLYQDMYVKFLRPHMVPGHSQGCMLEIFTRMIRPRQVSEIGIYSSYPALYLAEGLKEGGMLHTLEINDGQEDFTRPWLENSAHADRTKFYIGDALQLIPALGVTFDLVFVDGDKCKYIEYYKMTLAHLSPEGYIIADSTLWDGHVLEGPHNNDYRTTGIKTFNELVARDERVEKTILPLRDGLAIIRKK